MVPVSIAWSTILRPVPLAADLDLASNETTHPSQPPSILDGLLAGAALGAAWGLLENGVRAIYYRFFLGDGMLSIPPFGWLDVLATSVLAALEYAVVGLGIAAIALVVLRPLLGLVLAGRGTAWRTAFSPRFAVVFAALFVNLFWWSRFASRAGVDALKFAYSEPFHSPKRLLLSVAFAVLAALVGWIVASRLERARTNVARSAFLALLLVLAAGFFVRERSIAREQPTREAAGGRHNVVLVIVDTLRAFSMHCYGYERETTPRLDALARESVLFERAVVQAPYTWTSFGSIFTGKYPRRHGLVKMDPRARFNPRRNVTLQSHLDANGYRTGAFMTGMISNASGLLDGFQTYFEAMVGRDPVRRASVWTYFRSEMVLHAIANKLRQAFDPTMVPSKAIDWIEENRNGRFLAVVHLYSTHTPYDPPAKYDVFSTGYDGPIERFTTEMANLLERGEASLTEADHQRVIDLYDGGVLFADAMIGDIVDTLRETGLLEKTIVVVTSDHGEELGEHGLWEHDWMFNTNQLVPLLFRAPGKRGAGTRVATPVELIDVVPTIFELLEMDGPPDVDGESLVPWFDGARPKEDDFAFCENDRYLSVQNRDWKLVKNRFNDPRDPPRLYHLAADPLETSISNEQFPDRLRELAAQLAAYEARYPAQLPDFSEPMNPEVLRTMEELGYTNGGRPTEGEHVRDAAEDERSRPKKP